jgi:hypothetical protein
MPLSCRHLFKAINHAFKVLLFGALLLSSTAFASEPYAPAFSTQAITVPVDRCENNRCAELIVQSVRFVGHEAFNAFVEQSLVSMAWQKDVEVQPYQSLAGLTDYFRGNARVGEQLSLKTTVQRHSPSVVVLLLSQYRFEGGAHGESSSQYINWLLPQNLALSLESMLLPGAMPDFVAALKNAYKAWVATQVKTGSIDDVDSFVEQWPFTASDNVALMPNGLTVIYPRYGIAPGFFGEPMLVLPYAVLRHIIKPEILTQAASTH